MADRVTVIHGRMLDAIDASYDKQKGEFVYDLTMPTAIEAERLDKKADAILDQCFADTATGEELSRKCADQGINRHAATYATGMVLLSGIAGAFAVKGELVASDTVRFAFTEDVHIPATGQVLAPVICETVGKAGNIPAGAIKSFPKTLEGFRTVQNPESIANGYDEEDDESLRERYFIKVRTPATSGNKWHYLGWAKEVAGVGDARIIPLGNGAGTVTVILIDVNRQAAADTLIEAVAAHIEDERPIGANVTVKSAEELAVMVSLTLQIDSPNYTKEAVQKNIEDALVEYLKSIAFKETYVSYAKIGNTILTCAGVLDYSNLTVNGGIANLSISNTSVAVLGGVTIA